MLDYHLNRLITAGNLQALSVICISIALMPLLIVCAREIRSDEARVLEVIGWGVLPGCLTWAVVSQAYDQTLTMSLLPLTAALAVFGIQELLTAHDGWSVRPEADKRYELPETGLAETVERLNDVSQLSPS